MYRSIGTRIPSKIRRGYGQDTCKKVSQGHERCLGSDALDDHTPYGQNIQTHCSPIGYQLAMSHVAS